MGLRRGPDQSGALGPAPPDAAESRLQRAAGPGLGRAGRPLSLRLSLFCIPGTHSHPKGVRRLRLRPQGPLRPYLALEPGVHRPCWPLPATFCRDPPPPIGSNSMTPWTVAHPSGSSVHGILQARILSRLPCPPPGGLPTPGIKPGSPAPSALHCKQILFR